jgi:hypothetical protein
MTIPSIDGPFGDIQDPNESNCGMHTRLHIHALPISNLPLFSVEDIKIDSL